MSIALLLPLMSTKVKIETDGAFLSSHLTWYRESPEPADAVPTKKIWEGFQPRSDDMSSMQTPSETSGELLLMFLQEEKKKKVNF